MVPTNCPDLGVADVRWLTRQALVQDAPRRVHVGAAVHGLGADLLRGHVVDGPDELPRPRCRGRTVAHPSGTRTGRTPPSTRRCGRPRPRSGSAPGPRSRWSRRTAPTSVSRTYGGSPVRHSYRTHPAEYTSVRPSTASERICSGAT